jgi:hypothetical protein
MHKIVISLTKKTLVLFVNGRNIFEAHIVSGCEGTESPIGSFKSGTKWIVDKTNPEHGKTPWTKDLWGF